jgi:Arc/MetJ family transcription regulator
VPIDLDDDLVAEIDRLVGSEGRITFVRKAIQQAVRMEASAGAIASQVHEWDSDPAQRVRNQRQADDRRGG